MAGRGSSPTVDLDGTVAELAPRVLRYAVARLGDASLAEEVAQESLAALVSRWHGAGPPESADAFVFAIARRRVGRAVWRRHLFAPLDAARDNHARTPTPETCALAAAEVKRVRAALCRLSPRDRETILLVAVGELSMAAAAKALGLSLSAVKMRLARARSRLAALLEDNHDGARTL